MLNNINNVINNKSELIFKFKSFQHKFFEKSFIKILKKIKSMQIKHTKIISLPTRTQRFTVLRSPHIDKKSREQFEINNYNKILIIQYDSKNLNEMFKLNFLITYIKNSCGGCQLKLKYINK